MRDVMARYNHTLPERVTYPDKARLRLADKAGNVTKFKTVPPPVRHDRCAFLKCGNCGNAAIYWLQVHVLYPYQIRKCDVCGEDENILNGKNQHIQFAVRER